MARAIAGGIVVGAAIAACFSTPTRPAGDDSGVTSGDGRFVDGLVVDAMLNIDGNPTSCLQENFTGSGSGTCGLTNWASYQASGGSGGLSGGELSLALSGATSSFVHCTSAGSAWNRFTTEVTKVAATGSDNHTFVGLQSEDAQSRWGLEFYPQSGAIVFTVHCASALPSDFTDWQPLVHRFIKVERTMPAEITIYSSANNSTFQKLEMCSADATALDSASAQLRVFSVSGSGSTGSPETATFNGIELCHD